MANGSSVSTVVQLYDQLKLTPNVRKLAAWEHLDHAAGKVALGRPISINGNGHGDVDCSGVAITGYDLRGEQKGVYQIRLDQRTGSRKVLNPSGKLGRYINTTPGRLLASHVAVLSESVKSSYAILSSAERMARRNIKPVDINGLNGWLVRSEQGESEPNPDLELLAAHDVVYIPDANVWLPGRADLFTQVQRLCAHLTAHVGVRSLGVVKLPGDKDGADVVIPLHGDKAFWELVDQARPLWQYAFPSAQDFDAEDLTEPLLIEHLIPDRGIVVQASPSENFKTSWGMVLLRGLLEGRGKVANHFQVMGKVNGVLYCCPDMSHKMVLKYARQFRLNKHPNFRIRTMAEGDILYPDNPLVKEAARAGYYIVLDTLNYFSEALDDNNPQQLNSFVQKCRVLIDRYGCPGIMIMAHPTKAGARSSEIDVTEWVAGTYAKIGSVDAIFCMKKLPVSQTDPTPGSVYISREKHRPFMGVPCGPFTVSVLDGQGSCLERGEMPISLRPGMAELRQLLPDKKRSGRPETLDKDAKVKFMQGYIKNENAAAVANGKKPRFPSRTELAAVVNKHFNPMDLPGMSHDGKTLVSWLKEHEQDKKQVAKILAQKEQTKNGNT